MSVDRSPIRSASFQFSQLSQNALNHHQHHHHIPVQQHIHISPEHHRSTSTEQKESFDPNQTIQADAHQYPVSPFIAQQSNIGNVENDERNYVTVALNPRHNHNNHNNEYNNDIHINGVSTDVYGGSVINHVSPSSSNVPPRISWQQFDTEFNAWIRHKIP